MSSRATILVADVSRKNVPKLSSGVSGSLTASIQKDDTKVLGVQSSPFEGITTWYGGRGWALSQSLGLQDILWLVLPEYKVFASTVAVHGNYLWIELTKAESYANTFDTIKYRSEAKRWSQKLGGILPSVVNVNNTNWREVQVSDEWEEPLIRRNRRMAGVWGASGEDMLRSRRVGVLTHVGEWQECRENLGGLWGERCQSSESAKEHAYHKGVMLQRVNVAETVYQVLKNGEHEARQGSGRITMGHSATMEWVDGWGETGSSHKAAHDVL
ncbi:hypothetical protein IV203_008471 [Nitzschia inconspicua]|uniref:Uncharacterized protein n=1 Tax=Nitzschia inconspicua TaxID=303405 RepID=A0A9K3PM58_9STRA|nr:hypothetical protein IV203_008471 [Nitzschia inconspicua]